MRLVFQSIYLLVHLSVLGVFLLGLSARYIHPAIAWWPQPLAIGLPIAAGALALLTIADLLTQRWFLFVVSLAGLLLFGMRYASAITQDADDDAESLTIITFNSGGIFYMDRDRRAIRPLLLDESPDLMCLQEFDVDRQSTDQRVDESLQTVIDSLGYGIIAPTPPDGHRDPPPIISRLHLEESSVLGLSSRGETGPAGTVIRAQFAWNDRSFVLYNVHLESFSTRRPWAQGETLNPKAWIRFIRRTSAAFLQRSSEADEIRSMIDREELPVLLCGDFNTTPHQWTYRQLADGLRDAFRTHGGFWGPTFPARFPLFRIDYILTTDDWLVDEVTVGPRLPPDHRPVVAKLKLEPEE